MLRIFHYPRKDWEQRTLPVKLDIALQESVGCTATAGASCGELCKRRNAPCCMQLKNRFDCKAKLLKLGSVTTEHQHFELLSQIIQWPFDTTWSWVKLVAHNLDTKAMLTTGLSLAQCEVLCWSLQPCLALGEKMWCEHVNKANVTLNIMPHCRL